MQFCIEIQIETMDINNTSWHHLHNHDKLCVSSVFLLKNALLLQVSAGINDFSQLSVPSKQQSNGNELKIHPEYQAKRLSKFDLGLIQVLWNLISTFENII